MATTFKPSYGSNTAFTKAFASLANGAYWQTAFVDNSTNLFADATVYGHLKSGGTPTASNVYTLYFYWSNDGGTTYSNNASGSSASYSQPDTDVNMVVLATSLCTAVASLVSYFDIPSVCVRAGLQMLPQRWGVILKNGSGQALTATEGDHVISYMGLNMQGV